MTYNEWRDELKSNLLSVSESERRRVLDYYAEAYADRRDAGFSEREIIEDFGAPYDAAQRILAEDDGVFSDHADDPPYVSERERRRSEERNRREREREDRTRERERRREEERLRSERRHEEERRRHEERQGSSYESRNERSDYTWVFVLLCVIFCVPLFGLIMGMVGITIGLCVAPFGVMFEAVVTIGAGVGTMVGGSLAAGLGQTAIGVIMFGVSILLMAIFFKLVKWMWKLFKKFFGWVKSLFGGKERVR